MTFTVTYRAKDGALREERVEAADRAACVAACRARGIAPTGITAGEGRQARHPTSAKARGRVWPRLGIVLVVLGLLGILGYLVLAPREKNAPIREAPPKTEKPNAAPPSVAKPPKPRTTVHEVATNEPAVAPAGVPIQTNAVIRPGFFKPTTTLEDGTVVDLRPPPAIKDPMERALAAVAVPGGMAIPFAAALRRFSKEQIMEMLARDVEFSKDDSEAVAERKIALQQVKDQFRAFLNAGMTLDEAIRDVDRQMRKESMYQAAAYKGLAAAVRTGDAEFVNQFVKEQNVSLREQGLRTLTVPPQFRTESTETKENSKEK